VQLLKIQASKIIFQTKLLKILFLLISIFPRNQFVMLSIRFILLILLFISYESVWGQTILREVFTNITGSSVANLTSSPKFPYNPDIRTYQTNFESPTSFGDNYGTRMRGYVVPPVTGNYTFWIASDDNSQLYLSVGDSPYKARLIAYVNTYTSSRQWDKETNQRSAPIFLEGGKRYYIEALHKEGTGGDNLAVGWQLPDGTYERPIPGNRLQPWIIYTNPPVIISEPSDLIVSDEEQAVFHVEAYGADPMFYQWVKDGFVLERETTPTLFLDVVSILDNGSKFYCIISNQLGVVTSRVANLTVFAETNPPVAIVINPPPFSTNRYLSQIEILFNEPVQNVRAQDLIINGTPATNVIGFSAGPYIFSFQPVYSGEVQVRWSDSLEIIDDSFASNKFQGGAWSYMIDPNYEVPKVVITEFVAGNENGLTDENGVHEDWIEIQNQSPYPVNLAGWSLSDDERVPGKWVFPNRILQPYQFIVVFASGNDLKPEGTNNLHTNFKLSRDGEFLGLFTPEVPRRMACGFSPKYPEQRNDYSYGIDGSNNWVYFENPTPGYSNGFSSITGVVQEVNCSVDHGIFDMPFNVVLSTRTPDAIIRYTFDGSEPSATNGFIYTGPIRISGTTMLRAAAFKTNHLPSKTITRSYFFNLSPALLSLPVLSLVTATNHLYGPTGIIGIGGGYYSNGVWYPSGPGDYHNPSKKGREWERPVSVEYIDPKDNSGFQIDAGIRVHGANYIRPRYKPDSKFSFRLYFRGDYGPAKLNYPLFPNTPVTTFDQIVLRAGMNDPVNPFIRDELARRLGLDEGQVEMSGTFVNLFINGEYKGYYNPTERVASGTLQAHHGGGEDWDVITVGSVAQEGDTIEWNNLRNYVNTADVTKPEVYRNIMRRFDVTNFVDYLLLKHFTGGGDWPHNNWRAARERAPNGIFRYYLWDDEWGFGYNNRSPALNLFTNELAGSTEVAGFYKRLILNQEFRQLWIDRVHKHYFNGGALTDENAIKRHDELKTIVSGVISNFNLTIVTNWIPNRRSNVLAQFEQQGLIASSNAPVFSKYGGIVKRGYKVGLSCISGNIYFTTNGDDPRVMFSGTISPSAIRYTNGNPICLTRSITIRARTLSGTNWSALSEAVFKVEEMGLPVKITEIMYNSPYGDAFDFIEIMNYGGEVVNLSGFKFTGIDFMFPYGSVIQPGQAIVLISDVNPDLFLSQYPGVQPAGFFKGRLSDSGELIQLLDDKGNVVSSVNYSSSGLWDSRASGIGYSLELIDPGLDPRNPVNWRASVNLGGSPGQINPARMQSAIRINEFMAYNVSAVSNGNSFPDWIEIYNGYDVPVNLSGWSLTDDSNPRKFVFPNVTLESKQYLVVWCDKNYSAPGIHSGFGLKKEGQTIRLFDAFTNCIDAITYGLQLGDYSCGLDTNGEYVICLPTPGYSNVIAPVASWTNLFINEFMPNPPPDGNDWIEIINLSTNLPISLTGVFISNGKSYDRIWYPLFLPPRGIIVFTADEKTDIYHLQFKLPASGGTIALYDPFGSEIHKVVYPAMPENYSRGSIPDGSQNFYNFYATKSPGETNYLNVSAAIRLHEILARNVGSVTNFAGKYSDFIEIQNRAGYSVSLSGCSLSIGRPQKGDWYFPSDYTMPPRSFLVIWCDPTLPPMNSDPRMLNTGKALDGTGDAVYLFGADGRLQDYIEFGNQIIDKPLGRNPTTWQLLKYPTPGESNAPPETLGNPDFVVVNEWFTSGNGINDWFEIYNPLNYPVNIGGFYLTDDPSIFGKTNHQICYYTFVPPQGVIKFIADENISAGPNHVRFKLNKAGDTIRLYNQSLNLVNSVEFGILPENTSMGRYPDGSTNFIIFSNSVSPASNNYLDTDNDGIPDNWETEHGLNPHYQPDALEDSDGDGLSNYAEYLCGTDPNDPESVLKMDIVKSDSGEYLVLKFVAAPDRSYTLISYDTLGINKWSRVLNVSPSKDWRQIQIQLPKDESQRRFFKLLTPAITP